jgi:hypothetical protein
MEEIERLKADNINLEQARIFGVEIVKRLQAESARKDAEIRKLTNILNAYKHDYEHRPARPLPRRNCVKRWQGGA